MNNLAELMYGGQAVESGIVQDITESGYRIKTNCARYEGPVAVSCLLEPQAGDLVLFWVDAAGTAYILSILKRTPDQSAQSAPAKLLYDGNLDFEIKVKFKVRSSKGLSLTSARKILLNSRKLDINALQSETKIAYFKFLGRVVNAKAEKMRIAADTIDTLFRRAVQKLAYSFRYITKHDEVQAASSRMLVDGTLTMHTKNTMHTAEGHIKIDAEQIHLA
jgi:hypothetical protein